jgi:hypothetical protein
MARLLVGLPVETYMHVNVNSKHLNRVRMPVAGRLPHATKHAGPALICIVFPFEFPRPFSPQRHT